LQRPRQDLGQDAGQRRAGGQAQEVDGDEGCAAAIARRGQLAHPGRGGAGPEAAAQARQDAAAVTTIFRNLFMGASLRQTARGAAGSRLDLADRPFFPAQAGPLGQARV
jgi:hypothetical protein